MIGHCLLGILQPVWSNDTLVIALTEPSLTDTLAASPEFHRLGSSPGTSFTVSFVEHVEADAKTSLVKPIFVG